MQRVKSVQSGALQRGMRDLMTLLPHLLLLVNLLHSLLSCPLLDLPLQSRVVVILDVVVSAAREVLGNLRPTIAVLLVQLKDALVFGSRPLDFLDVGVQMVVPPKLSDRITHTILS